MRGKRRPRVRVSLAAARLSRAHNMSVVFGWDTGSEAWCLRRSLAAGLGCVVDGGWARGLGVL
jgi:hypothetical protein